MKKAILILSYVFGGIALLVLIGIFLYYNVWMNSFKYMEPDSDTSSYESYHMIYDNGTLAVRHENSLECDIITPSSKKTVDSTSEEYNAVFKYNYGFDLSKNSLCVMDENNTLIASFLLENIMVDTDTTDESFSAYLYPTASCGMFRYSLKTNDDSYYLGVDMDTQNLYVEHLVNEEVTTSFYYKYDLATCELVDTYKAEFCDNVTQGISVIRNVSYHDTIAVDNYVFYIFSYNNYLKKKLYRHNTSSGETVVVGEFENCNFTANQSDIYYTFYNEYDEQFNDIQDGIWKMDIDTLETTLVSEKYFDREILCTENYIYAYKNLDIKFSEIPTMEDFRIERGYDVHQIPISNE